MRKKKKPVKQKTIAYLWSSLGVFVLTILICLFISPEGLHDNLGISYYAHIGPFIIPFVLGSLFTAYLLILAARSIPQTNSEQKILKKGILLFVVLLAGVVAIPDYINELSSWLHVGVAVLLFFCEFCLASWISFVKARDLINYLLFLALLSIGILALLSELNVLSYLLLTEVAFQIVFFLIIIREIAKRRK